MDDGAGPVMEKFRRTWRRELVSNLGFRVRLAGRTVLLYRESGRDVRISCEAMAGPGMSFIIYADSIDAVPEDRLRIVSNIQRAALHAGWHVSLQ